MSLVKNRKPMSGIIINKNKSKPNKTFRWWQIIGYEEDIKNKQTFHSQHEEWDKKGPLAWQEIVG